MKEAIIKAFEGYEVEKIIHANHSEYYAILKWHQPTDGLFERLAKLSLEAHAIVSIYNAGDEITIHVEEVDQD